MIFAPKFAWFIIRYFTFFQDKGGVYNNPELELMAKEIQTLLSEKIQIEKEIQETEYNMTVKKTELNSLQGEFDTLSSTLKQLTNQKDVAQRRLDDLDAQVRLEFHEFKVSSKSKNLTTNHKTTNLIFLKMLLQQQLMKKL